MNLSIIIPAYNEEKRLPTTLNKVFKHLQENFKSDDYEVLVANDGSKDNTESVVKELCSQYPQLKLLDYGINRGRGARPLRDARAPASGPNSIAGGRRDHRHP